MKTVYILGAGFSKEAKLPLADEFFPAMQEVRDTLENQSPHIMVPLNQILTFHADLKKSFITPPININNIEDVFSLIASDSLGRNDSNLQRFMMQMAVAYTLSIKTRNLCLNDPSIVSDYARWLSIMVGNVKRDDLGNTAIITLNYDEIIEISCRHNSFKYNHGFVPDLHPYELRKDEQSFLTNSVFTSSLDTNSLSIYKLHGSVRWLRIKSHQRELGLRIGHPLSHITGEEFAFLPSDYEILIEPPIFGKTISDPYLQRQWSCAYDALRNAHRVIIIGYSFPRTDQHIPYLLISALRNNSVGRSCVIVNPESSENKEIVSIAGHLYHLHVFDYLDTLDITAREFFDNPKYEGMR